MTHSVHSAAKQFFITFAKTLKKNAFHTVALFLFMLVSLNAYLVSIHVDAMSATQQLIYNLQQTKYCISGFHIDSFLIGCNCLVVGVSAILLSVYNFRFLHTKKAANVYFSLGVRRSTLFAGKFAGCVTSQLIGVALPFLICGIYNVYLFGSTPEMWQAILYYGASMTAIALFPFAVCVLCMIFSGSTVESLVCGTLNTFLPSALYNGSYLYSELYLSGAKFGVSANLVKDSFSCIRNEFGGGFQFLDFLYPVVSTNFGDALAAEKLDVPAQLPSVGYPLLYLGLFIVLAVAARFAFVYQKTEKAAFLGACPKLIAVSVFALGSVLIPFGTYIWREYGFSVVESSFWAVLFTGIAFGLFVGIAAILLRSKAKLRAQLRTGGIMAAALLAFMLIFVTGGFGYEKRIPDASRITAAGITFNTSAGAVNYNESYVYLGDNRDVYEGFDEQTQANNFLQAYLQAEGLWGDSSFVYFEDAQAVETIRGIHEMMIADRRNTYNNYYEGSVMVSYKLANGNSLTRVYNHISAEAMLQLQGLLGSQAYLDACAAQVSSYSDFNLILFSKNCTAMTDVVLEDSDILVQKQLREALASDIRNGRLPMDFKSSTAPLGYISFGNYGDDATGRINFPIYHFSYSYDYMVVPVFDTMTETLAVLRQSDKLQYFADIKTPVSAKIYPNPLNGEDLQAVSERKLQTLQFNGFVVDWSYYSDSKYEGDGTCVPLDAVTINDPALLAQLSEQTYFSYFVNEPGYFVQLRYVSEEGWITDALVYVPADKMPASLK